MRFLLKTCVVFIITKCVISEEQCLSSNKTVGKCDDWRKISVLVADQVSRSIVDDNTKTKPNMLPVLIRAASSVIGRGSNSLTIIIVNGLMLLTQTILTVSKNEINRGNGDRKKNYVPAGHPTDWILKNSYIKSMVDDAMNKNLPVRLEQLASGIPCLQLLMCRLSPIIHNMQRQVKERWHNSNDKVVWNVSDWQEFKRSAEYCKKKNYVCEKEIKPDNLS